MNLPLRDHWYLEAAKGWLELGDWQSANDEIERIRASMRAHPDVLKTRFDVYIAAKQWELALAAAQSLVKHLPNEPHWWINQSFALHKLKRTKEAQSKLLPALALFPLNWRIAYNLSCYSCQLGQIDDARQLLQLAYSLGDFRRVKRMALEDPDLAPLFVEG